MSDADVTVSVCNVGGRQLLEPTMFSSADTLSDVIACLEPPPDLCEWLLACSDSAYGEEPDTEIAYLVSAGSHSLELTATPAESRMKIAAFALEDFTAYLRCKDDVLENLQLAIDRWDMDFCMWQEDLATRWPLMLKALAMGNGLPRVKGLWFYNCRLGDENLTALLGVLKMTPELEKLNLGCNRFGIESARRLSAWIAEAPASLKCAYLQKNDWGAEGDQMLITSNSGREMPLELLYLEDNPGIFLSPGHFEIFKPMVEPQVGGHGYLDNRLHRLGDRGTFFQITAVSHDKKRVDVEFYDGKVRADVQVVEGLLID